jgi:hypothetical protein
MQIFRRVIPRGCPLFRRRRRRRNTTDQLATSVQQHLTLAGTAVTRCQKPDRQEGSVTSRPFPTVGLDTDESLAMRSRTKVVTILRVSSDVLKHVLIAIARAFKARVTPVVLGAHHAEYGSRLIPATLSCTR